LENISAKVVARDRQGREVTGRWQKAVEPYKHALV
jgi:hypothetical protein